MTVNCFARLSSILLDTTDECFCDSDFFFLYSSSPIYNRHLFRALSLSLSLSRLFVICSTFSLQRDCNRHKRADQHLREQERRHKHNCNNDSHTHGEEENNECCVCVGSTMASILFAASVPLYEVNSFGSLLQFHCSRSHFHPSPTKSSPLAPWQPVNHPPPHSFQCIHAFTLLSLSLSLPLAFGLFFPLSPLTIGESHRFSL